MKRQIIAVLLLIVAIPACKRRKASSSTNAIAQSQSSRASASQGIDIDLLDNACSEADDCQEQELDSFYLVDDPSENAELICADENPVCTYPFQTMLCEFDEIALRRDQHAIFDTNLQLARAAACQGHTIMVEGHACSSAGSKAYNLVLSEERAQEVKKRLVKAGVADHAVKAIGRGSEMPIVPYGDKHAQAPNRRVEIYTLS